MLLRSLWLLMLYASGASCQQPTPAVIATPESRSASFTLEQAIAVAQASAPALAAATAERRAAAAERTNARTSLLPSVILHNQAIYTQPNGVAASRIGQTVGADSPVFIANNAVREYASQGVIEERVGLGTIAAIHAATANALRAEAEAEIARRGLVITLTALFYGLQNAGSKVDIASEALREANHFFELTQKREGAREIAHSDVLKAQLQQQQRERDLADAKLQFTTAQLELGVLLFADPSTAYSLDTSAMPAPLPQRTEIEALAMQNNPEVRSAIAGLQVAQANSSTARAALTPDLTINYTYGIDATNLGVNGPDGIRNLGYSFGATLDIPVWDWLATERKIKVSKLRENAAKIALTASQRRLLADLQELYATADLAAQQLRSLGTSVTTARDSLRLTNLRYVDGESTALEVVDAQTALLSARSAEVDGQLRYLMARVQLQTLTGRLP